MDPAAGPVNVTLSSRIRACALLLDTVPQQTCLAWARAPTVPAPARAAAVASPLVHGNLMGPAVTGEVNELTVTALLVGQSRLPPAEA